MSGTQQLKIESNDRNQQQLLPIPQEPASLPAMALALERAHDAFRRLGTTCRFRATGNPDVFCSTLPTHWRSNKSLPTPFVVIALFPVLDGTKVTVAAGNEDNYCADVKNNVAEMHGQVARFSDLRFVGKSGRGKCFNLSITLHTAPVVHSVIVSNVIKVTVDGPRDPRTVPKSLNNPFYGQFRRQRRLGVVAATALPPQTEIPLINFASAGNGDGRHHQFGLSHPLLPEIDSSTSLLTPTMAASVLNKQIPSSSSNLEQQHNDVQYREQFNKSNAGIGTKPSSIYSMSFPFMAPAVSHGGIFPNSAGIAQASSIHSLNPMLNFAPQATVAAARTLLSGQQTRPNRPQQQISFANFLSPRFVPNLSATFPSLTMPTPTMTAGGGGTLSATNLALLLAGALSSPFSTATGIQQQQKADGNACYKPNASALDENVPLFSANDQNPPTAATTAEWLRVQLMSTLKMMAGTNSNQLTQWQQLIRLLMMKDQVDSASNLMSQFESKYATATQESKKSETEQEQKVYNANDDLFIDVEAADCEQTSEQISRSSSEGQENRQDLLLPSTSSAGNCEQTDDDPNRIKREPSPDESPEIPNLKMTSKMMFRKKYQRHFRRQAGTEAPGEIRATNSNDDCLPSKGLDQRCLTLQRRRPLTPLARPVSAETQCQLQRRRRKRGICEATMTETEDELRPPVFKKFRRREQTAETLSKGCISPTISSDSTINSPTSSRSPAIWRPFSF